MTMKIDLIKEQTEKIGFLETAEMMGISLERVLEIVEAEYKIFKDLEFVPTEEFLNGIKTTLHFDNEYGISVVRHKYSYGSGLDLYEMAIMNKDNDIVYDTPVTNDVLGYLTENDVSNYMIKVQRLEKKVDSTSLS
jgi:hypothetical protein